ncbi:MULTISPECIES: DUF1643 domain-containing protein [Sinorhizobium]|uniref:DUF1643 domain-containing protein n=1 Tax=Sinorhizobium TaxID=28105 RepID=UPI000BE846AF|nr:MULTISPECIES: DUF1643 domain-containing protein [Sinorhizobium]PDT55075.1 hypothetical protein CO664_08400 [Sinorhizobium sp. NG07B]POH32118.1 hypothetical protein ATY30_12020 [Sinorhizobium americanum]
MSTDTLDMFATETRSSAIISGCGAYRYRLERQWDGDKPKVAFLMLNPSTADASQDDPTIRRCIGFAKAWGFGGLIVGNLFALRSTDPKALYGHPDPIGADNDQHILAIAKSAHKLVCAWGTHGALHARAREVYEMLEFFNLAALKVTVEGHPAHPLYIAANTEPKAYFAP